MYFYFNNNSSESFKVILSDFPQLPFVQEEIKLVEVGGKDGTLTKRTGKYKDLVISLECELLDIENYNEAIRNINNWINDIEDNRLFFIDNPSRCYKVKKVTAGNIKNELNIYGTFTIEFTCYPFIYSTEEYEIEVNNNSEFYYSGDIETHPRIVLSGCSGNIQITINDIATQLNDTDGQIIIDYPQALNEEGKSITNNMIGKFPTLIKGINSISWTGTIKGMKIKENALYRG
jgi:predicted phage tail component-like protein